MSQLTHLFQPIQINGLRLPNRVIMPAMVTQYAAKDGTVTPRLINYYAARAKGGPGLILVEGSYVDILGKGFAYMLGINQDKHIPGLARLCRAVHEKGSKIGIQLLHMGRRASSKHTFASPVGPSALPAAGMEVPRELSLAEIQNIVYLHGDAARRAVEAGFDAVEVHMAHGYLINQFLSPYANLRNDEYGGSLEKRARLGYEIVQKIREVVGPEFPVFCKINGSDFLTPGIDIEMCKSYVKIMESAGIDAVTVSGGMQETAEYVAQPMALPRGCHVERAAEVKKVARVPVIAIGRINNPNLAEEILEKGSADIIAMGRALIADPEFLIKAREMRFQEIRPCIACVQGCTDRMTKGVGIACLTNPTVGREEECEILYAVKPKRILVAGGGPAGMMCALTAAQRGHEVFLYEKERELGGLLRLAAVPPYKNEIAHFTGYLIDEVRKSTVSVVTGREVTSKVLEEIRPDEVILATGSIPLIPDGLGANVTISAEKVLSGEIKIEGSCIVIGGGMVGCETAHFLAGKGNNVTIVEMLDDVALDMGSRPRKLLLQKLLSLGVNWITQAKVVQVGEDCVEFDRAGLRESIKNVKNVVIAVGYRPNRHIDLEKICEQMQIPCYSIGDCVQVRKALEAVREGFDIARSL